MRVPISSLTSGGVWFDARASSDGLGDPLTYRWDFGDGNAAAGALVAHTYAAEGRYEATLTVDDGTGASNAVATDTRSVLINHRPKAVAGDHREICLGDILTFDAGESSDPDGQELAIFWDFGDGATATTEKVRKTYDQPGVYPVTLTVADGSGLANERHQDRVYVSVSDRRRLRRVRMLRSAPIHRFVSMAEVRRTWTASSTVTSGISVIDTPAVVTPRSTSTRNPVSTSPI